MDTLVVGLISSLALLSMLGCLAVVLWFRVKQKTVSLLLLPSLEEIAGVMTVGIFLPLLAHQALIHLLPHSGREYSLAYAWPKYIALQVFLIIAIGWLTLTLSSHFLNRRCRQLGVPLPPKGHWGWLAGAGMLLVAQLVFGCIPEFGTVASKSPSLWPLLPAVVLLLLVIIKILMLIPPPVSRFWGRLVFLAIAIGLFFIIKLFVTDYILWEGKVGADYYQMLALNLFGLLGVPAFLWLFFAWRRYREPQPQPWPFYRGTLARSLIPVLAFAMLILNLASTPWYRFQERRLVEQKLAWFSLGNEQPGWCNQKDEKLRAEMKAVLEKLGK
jgi:hypothetical protein